ncbi:MAG TPA: ABC transporter ATP-binding protein [Xanthobacteraceae bacterium]|nr:ABC transporter ATP-binding protein [Xanthobacteraceae bacterium]
MDRSAQPAVSNGAQVRLRKLSKTYGGLAAVDGISFDVPAGAFVSLLGPSGSGKTTTLNLIAGFLTPDLGDILIDERSVADVPPHKRNIGMVFQSYSLFPHMTVADNVGFPLRMRSKLNRQAAQKRIAEMLALVQLSHLGARYPRQLSGGQQQRVAMARALVSAPRLLLMDEPLGALDKKLREQMQAEIKRIHRSVGTTVVYVTHDQSEALTMSDLVVVMHRGRVAQIGTPRALYESPADAFVADFIGDSNLLAVSIVEAGREGCVVKTRGGTAIGTLPASFATMGARAFLLIRPEDMSVQLQSTAQADGSEQLTGVITELSFHGDVFKLAVAAGDDVLKAKVAREQGGSLELGRQVVLNWRRDAARLLPPASGEAGIEAVTS